MARRPGEVIEGDGRPCAAREVGPSVGAGAGGWAGGEAPAVAVQPAAPAGRNRSGMNSAFEHSRTARRICSRMISAGTGLR